MTRQTPQEPDDVSEMRARRQWAGDHIKNAKYYMVEGFLGSLAVGFGVFSIAKGLIHESPDDAIAGGAIIAAGSLVCAHAFHAAADEVHQAVDIALGIHPIQREFTAPPE